MLDFEATCWGSDNGNMTEQMEIIEFPSVLYRVVEEYYSSENIKSIDITELSTFAEYVRPTMNPVLSDFCTELTGITQATVDAADEFAAVYERHQKWLAANLPVGARLIMATYGHWDLKTQLPRELRNKALRAHEYYKTYVNVKEEFKTIMGERAGGMPDVLAKLGLPLVGRHHSGIDDTRNIARIMFVLIGRGHIYDKFTIMSMA